MKYKLSFAVSAGVLMLVAVVMVLATTQNPVSQAQEGSNNSTISVTGSGTAYSAPDIAYVTLGVEIFNADVSAATTDANTRTEAILTALKSNDIADSDIRTEGFNIWFENFYGPEGPTGEGRFRVANTMRVTVRNVDNIPTILVAALDAGANPVQGVQFSVADRTSVESTARANAVENAKARAEELAGLMDVSVGEVVAISEITNNAFGLSYANEAGGFGGGGGGEPPIEAGSLAINVEVQITFSLVR